MPGVKAPVRNSSLGKGGFGPARRVARALDEEKGRQLVFADGTDSIYIPISAATVWRT